MKLTDHVSIKKMMSNTTDGTYEWMQTANLTACIVITTMGSIWNGTLLFMFARHKEIRTSANIMIFNLAVCDSVNLIIVAPLRYKYHYPHEPRDNLDLCRFITIFHHWIICAGALSLVALSIQKYCITVPNLTFHVHFKSGNKTLITTVYIILIWIVSLLISLPYAVIKDVYGHICENFKDRYAERILCMVNLVFFCILLSFLMFFFNHATARRLERSVNTLAGRVNNRTVEPARKRTANMLTVLSVLFLLTHVPYFYWDVYSFWTHIDEDGITDLIFEYVSKNCLLLNSCCNPMVLYMTSHRFKKLFQRYFCCSRVQTSAVSSVQCSNTQPNN